MSKKLQHNRPAQSAGQQATGLDARASRVKWPAQFMSHCYGISFTEYVFECHCLSYNYGQIPSYFVILKNNNDNDNNDDDNNDDDNNDRRRRTTTTTKMVIMIIRTTTTMIMIIVITTTLTMTVMKIMIIKMSQTSCQSLYKDMRT